MSPCFEGGLTMVLEQLFVEIRCRPDVGVIHVLGALGEWYQVLKWP